MEHARWGAAAVAGAAAALALAAPASAQGVQPAVEWQVRDTSIGADVDWSDCDPGPTRTAAALSAIIGSTGVELVGKGTPAPPHHGTSIETTDLGIDVAAGDTVRVRYTLPDGADPSGGAVRLFIYDHADGDTDCEAPTAFAAAPDDGSTQGTLTIPVGFTGTIGTAGMVYDSSNGGVGGSVVFSELTVAGTLVSFTPPDPQPNPSPSQAADPGCELVDQLEVTDEHDRAGYDRDLFGDYDRDALLAASLSEHGDHYSTWDDTHYGDASEVDVDHTVALAEAWDSGAHSWGDAERDQFAADPANLTLLTDNLNQSKGDRDIAEWVPPFEAHVDEYVVAYVDVKVAYDLRVDPAERDVLLALAEDLGLCPGNDPGGPGGGGGGSADDKLPTTGEGLPLYAGGAAVLLVAGGGLYWLARRRGMRFTT